MTKKEQVLKIVEIAKRAEEMELLEDDRLLLIMDLRNAHEQFDLRLDEFLEADNFNFAHDVIGIQNHINRDTYKVEGHFLPRFA